MNPKTPFQKDKLHLMKLSAHTMVHRDEILNYTFNFDLNFKLHQVLISNTSLVISPLVFGFALRLGFGYRNYSS